MSNPGSGTTQSSLASPVIRSQGGGGCRPIWTVRRRRDNAGRLARHWRNVHCHGQTHDRQDRFRYESQYDRATRNFAYPEPRRRFSDHPIRHADVPVEHALSIPLPTPTMRSPWLRWVRQSCAAAARPTTAHGSPGSLVGSERHRCRPAALRASQCTAVRQHATGRACRAAGKQPEHCGDQGGHQDPGRPYRSGRSIISRRRVWSSQSARRSA
jgi:hypothetical protein